jgi:hypothetical protein
MRGAAGADEYREKCKCCFKNVSAVKIIEFLKVFTIVSADNLDVQRS